MIAFQGKVAIIIITYNSLSKLGSFFDSVLWSVFSQDYPDFEVIIVDNCSKDRTPDYVENLCKNNNKKLWLDRRH